MDELTAYIPMDRRQALAHGEGLPDRTTGAALFADISGFTPLTRAFARELGTRRGAEALLGVLNPLFERLIEPVHTFGGSVISFVGDAITCWFDDLTAPPPPGRGAVRAVACALAIQVALQSCASIRTPRGNEITLSIKVAVAGGPARRFVVGDPAILGIDALAGATLARMAAAEQHASPDEVVVSQEVATRVGAALRVTEWRGDGHFAVVGSLDEHIPPQPWPALPTETLTDAQLRSWVLPDVYAQLRRGEGLLGDLRPATPLFCKFGGIDYDGDDAAGAQLDAFVRWVQGIAHRHEGSLLQLTIGDKGAILYLAFGAPVAHEDDSVRALHTALALRDLPPDLRYIGAMQMGLTRGELWTGRCGAATRHSYSVMGSDVNLAARLMTAARPGQILVTERVRGDSGVAVAFALEHVGDWQYKGFADPIPTYAVSGERLAGERIFPEAMVGRDAEWQRLVTMAQPLFQGRLAGAVLLYGEAGIGKSRLAYALRKELGEQVTWFTGQCDQVLREAFNPFVYWLKRYFLQSPEVDAAENRRRLETRLQGLHDALVGIEAAGRIREELLRSSSFVGALLGLHWPGSLYTQVDNSRLRYQNTLFALVNLLQAESLRRPVVFLVEDAHWLDASSRDVLATLSRVAADFPLLLLITSRYADDGSRPALALDERLPAVTIDLNVLEESALRALAEDALGGPVSAPLLRTLHERSQANPFFAQQLLRYFQENGLLTLAGTPPAWALRETTTELPAGINAILVARIDRLALEIQTVVKAAAVLGREFEVRLLAQVLRQDVDPALRIGEQEQLWSALGELRYIFKHALLRDAAYEMQLRAHLRRLHRAVAEAYEQLYAADLSPYYGDLAYHYGQAEHVDAECRYARLAGEQAGAAGRLADAAGYLTRVLELTPENPAERFEVLLAREKVYYLLGDRSAQAEDLVALAALVGLDGGDAPLPDPGKQAAVALRRAAYAEAICDYAAASAAAQLAIAHAEAAGDASAAAQGRDSWGIVLLRQSLYTEAQVQLETALAGHRAAGNREGEGNVLNNLGIVARDRGDLAAARAFYEQALAARQGSGDRVGEGATLNNLGIIAHMQGNLVTARAFYEQALAIGQAVGDRRGAGMSLNNLGIVTGDEGDLAAARAYYEQGLAIRRAVGDRRGQGLVLGNLANLARDEGDLAAARSYYEQTLAICQAVSDRLGEGMTLLNLGILTREEGDREEARAFYEQALAIVRAVGDQDSEGTILNYLGSLARDRGDLAAARSYYEQALAIHIEEELVHAVAEDRAGLAATALAAGDCAAAQAAIAPVLDYLADHPAWDRAEDADRSFLTTYQVLAALAHPQAAVVLESAYTRLAARAAHLTDDEARHTFWHNLPARRALLRAWEAHQS